jgi:hypothetical protein
VKIDPLKNNGYHDRENDYGTEARFLFYIKDAVQDGVILPNGSKRVISKHIHFVEINENGTALNACYAPYLDYRAANEEEQTAIREFIKDQEWLKTDVEDIAKDYATAHLTPAHVSEVARAKQRS